VQQGVWRENNQHRAKHRQQRIDARKQALLVEHYRRKDDGCSAKRCQQVLELRNALFSAFQSMGVVGGEDAAGQQLPRSRYWRVKLPILVAEENQEAD